MTNLRDNNHDSLHSLFSAELDRDSADTDASLEAEPEGLDKRLPEAPVVERSRSDDSPGGISRGNSYELQICRLFWMVIDPPQT